MGLWSLKQTKMYYNAANADHIKRVYCKGKRLRQTESTRDLCRRVRVTCFLNITLKELILLVSHGYIHERKRLSCFRYACKSYRNI